MILASVSKSLQIYFLFSRKRRGARLPPQGSHVCLLRIFLLPSSSNGIVLFVFDPNLADYSLDRQTYQKSSVNTYLRIRI